MEEAGIRPVPADERIGHEDGSAQRWYTHVPQGIRDAVLEELTARREASLEARAGPGVAGGRAGRVALGPLRALVRGRQGRALSASLKPVITKGAEAINAVFGAAKSA
ncbi:hypothetical protein GCM10022254_59150 [Actinomadura meridiana]|uniref:Uncharacterized protein n=1 Tax=Actinomadura meridiana TaxID=559626 RepID=A0ABP8CHH2_9ACTN